MSPLSLFPWWKSRRKSKSKQPKDQRPIRKPGLEILEDRVMPGMMLELSGLFAAFALPTGSGLFLEIGDNTTSTFVQFSTDLEAIILPASEPSTIEIITNDDSSVWSSEQQPISIETSESTDASTATFQSVLTEQGQSMESTDPGGMSEPDGWDKPIATSSEPSNGIYWLDIRSMSDDTGWEGDRLTKDTTLTLSGYGPSNTSISAYEGERFLGSAQIDDEGTFQIALTGAFTHGQHTVSLAVDDSEISASYWFTVDTIPPEVKIDAPEFTNDVTPTIRFELPTVDEYGTNPEVKIDFDANHDGDLADEGEVDYATVYAWGGFAQLDFQEPLAEGEYTIRARATDLAGNTGSSTATMYIDPNAGYVRDTDVLRLINAHTRQPNSNGTWNPAPDWSKLIGPEYVDYSGEMNEAGEWQPVYTTWAGKTNLYAHIQQEPNRDQLYLDETPRTPIYAQVTITPDADGLKATVQDLGLMVNSTDEYWMTQTDYRSLGTTNALASTPRLEVQFPSADAGEPTPSLTLGFDVDSDGNQMGDREVGSATLEIESQYGELTFQRTADGTYALRVPVSEQPAEGGSETGLQQLYRQLFNEQQMFGGTGMESEDPEQPPPLPALNWVGKTSVAANVVASQGLNGQVALISDPRVLVNARVTQIKYQQQFAMAMQDLGMSVINQTADGLVVGWLPVGKLAAAQDVEHFGTFTAVYRPRTRAGLADNQGDPIMGGPAFRSSQSVDGTGQKVGVISDSVNRVGTGIAASQGTGDLPASIQVLQDGNPGDSDEGRAMLEIVHDVAPGAALAFATGVGGPVTFANNIRNLAAAGATVIVDDLAYDVQPRFNDGRVAMAVDDVYNAGIYYVTAAGNDADHAYLSDWRGTAGSVGTGATLVTGTFFDFGGGDFRQNFLLFPGERIEIVFQWDSAYLEGGSTGLPNFQVQTDLNVYITNFLGTAISASAVAGNAGTDQAFERAIFTNTAATPFLGSIAIHLAAGPAPQRLFWLALEDPTTNTVDPQAEYEGAPSLYGHVLAKGATAVGAVSAVTVPFFGQSPNVAESFTSLGGDLDVRFDRNGNRLATPEIRSRPQVAAPDNVNTSFFGFDSLGDADTLPNFTGTSAAAPQVAAAAALLLQQARFQIPPDELVAFFQETAVDVDAPGPDALTGAGRIFLQPFLRNADQAGIEPNETSAEAAFLGVLQRDGIGNLGIKRKDDGLPDYDWFRWVAGRDGILKISSTIRRGSGVLEFSVWTIVGRSLTMLASQAGGGGATVNMDIPIAFGQQIYVQIKGRESVLGLMDEGNYSLIARIV